MYKKKSNAKKPRNVRKVKKRVKRKGCSCGCK